MQVVMIFDIPTPEHISSLTSAFEKSTFYNQFLGPKEGKDYTVNSIFHLCGEGVLEDDRYKAFLAGFAPDVNVRFLSTKSAKRVLTTTQHIVSSREHSADPITFTGVSFNQLRLNQLDPELFPVPKFQLEPKKPLSSANQHDLLRSTL